MTFEDMIFEEMNGHSVEEDKLFVKGYNQALKKIKDASVIFDGEKIYGSNTKVILITEEKYNEIFNK